MKFLYNISCCELFFSPPSILLGFQDTSVWKLMSFGSEQFSGIKKKKKKIISPLLEHLLSWKGILMDWISNYFTFSSYIVSLLKKKFYFLGNFLLLSSNPYTEFLCMPSNF